MQKTKKDTILDIAVNYPEASNLETTEVIISCKHKFSGWVRLENEATKESTSYKTLNQTPTIITVKLPNQQNIFSIKTFSLDWSETLASHTTIQINRIETMPSLLKHSIWLEKEIQDENMDCIGEELATIGTLLPRNITTTAKLANLDTSQPFIIKIWQGNRKNLRANQLILDLQITNKDTGKKLPPKTEIQIQLEITTNNQISGYVVLPYVKKTFQLNKHPLPTEPNSPTALRNIILETERLLSKITDKTDKQTIPLNHNLLLNTAEPLLKYVETQHNQQDTNKEKEKIKETVQSAIDDYLGIRHIQRQRLLREEWDAAVNTTQELLEHNEVTVYDKTVINQIINYGNYHYTNGQLRELQNSIQMLENARQQIRGKNKHWWQTAYNKFLPKDPNGYTNPSLAQHLIGKIPLIQNTDEIKSNVLQLFAMLPHTYNNWGIEEKRTGIC